MGCWMTSSGANVRPGIAARQGRVASRTASSAEGASNDVLGATARRAVKTNLKDHSEQHPLSINPGTTSGNSERAVCALPTVGD